MESKEYLIYLKNYKEKRNQHKKTDQEKEEYEKAKEKRLEEIKKKLDDPLYQQRAILSIASDMTEKLFNGKKE